MKLDSLKELNQLNEILREEEINVQKSARKILNEWRSRPPDAVVDTDIEIEVCFDYYTKDDDDPFHIYNMVLLEKEDGSGFIQDLFEMDWTHATGLPQLNTPVCYTLHDLIDHGNFPRAYWQVLIQKLDFFWVDLKVTYQRKISIHEK